MGPLLKKWIMFLIFIPQILFTQNNVGISFYVPEIIERVPHRPPREDKRILFKHRFNITRLQNEKIPQWSKSGEFLIDTNAVYVPAAYYQRCPSIVFDGTNYLVVWEDFRSGTTYDIFGARISSDGIVIDQAGILISPSMAYQYSPSVAFDGTNYFVVWQDNRNGYHYDIYGARVSSNGIVLDPDGIPISTAYYDQCFPSITFDGTNYFVVWQDRRNGNNDIYGARISPEGTVIDPQGIPISTAVGHQCSPSIAFDGTNYFVVWRDWRSNFYDIYGARVSTDGTVIDPQGIPISTAEYEQSYPSVAFDGTNYFVVWQDNRNNNLHYDIYGARVSINGIVIDPEGIPISTATYSQKHPSISFDGTNYLVVWHDYRNGFTYDIYGARVSTNGTVLDPQGIPISTAEEDQWYSYVAFDGINYVVIWQDNRNGSNYDIYGARISTDGTVLDPEGILISTEAHYQFYPSIAFDGTNYLVIWQDYRSGTYYSDIYGSRVSVNGTLLDPDGIPISIATNDQWFPSIIFGGSNYLVVWEDFRSGTISDIYGARISPNGIVLDPDGIPISTAPNYQTSPSVAFDGTNYLIVWEDYRNCPYDCDIYGARVSPDGTVLDTAGIPISLAPRSQLSPSVVFDGTNYFVIWYDFRNGYPYYSDIYGARVSPNGIVLDPDGIPISTALHFQWSPSIAFDGTNYLIVWEDFRSDITSDIYGARVSPNGTVLDPEGIPISTAPYDQYSPAVAFDGTNYLVIWEDYRSGTTYDIYGAQISTSGIVIDSFPISTQDGNQFSPAVAHGPGNQLLIVYSGWSNSINNHPPNTMRIWGKFYPFPGIDEKFVKEKIQNLILTPTIFKDKLILKFTNNLKSPIEITLYDITGQRIFKKTYPFRHSIVISHQKIQRLASGVYFLNIKFDKKNSHVFKLIKE